MENKKYEQILYYASIILGIIFIILGLKLYPMIVLINVIGIVLLIFGCINLTKLYIKEKEVENGRNKKENKY